MVAVKGTAVPAASVVFRVTSDATLASVISVSSIFLTATSNVIVWLSEILTLVAPWAGTKVATGVAAAVMLSKPVMACAVCGISAVSYTHLDVYKRQAFEHQTDQQYKLKK